MHTQLIIDWRMAKGLTFRARDVQRVLGPMRVGHQRLLRLRERLGFVNGDGVYERSIITLGQAIVLCTVIGARLRTPSGSHVLVVLRDVARLLDQPYEPMPELIALMHESDGVLMCESVHELPTEWVPCTVIDVCTLVSHLCNGKPERYGAHDATA